MEVQSLNHWAAREVPKTAYGFRNVWYIVREKLLLPKMIICLTLRLWYLPPARIRPLGTISFLYITPNALLTYNYFIYNPVIGWILCPPPQKIRWSPKPQDLRMWSYLETVSLQMWVVKLRCGHTGAEWVPNAYGRCPVKKTATPGGCHVRWQRLKLWLCKPGHLNIMDQPPEASKRQRRIPLQVSEGAWPCWHLDFGLQASRTVRQ